MTTINLLPWREIARAEKAKHKKFFLLCFVALLLLWMICHIGLNVFIATYDEELSDLQSQLTDLISQTEKNAINASSSIIDRLHANQLELIGFLRLIEPKMQNNIALSVVNSQKNNIVITGYADSVLAISQFVDSCNRKNKLLPMTILNIRNNNDFSEKQFSVKLIRSVMPWIDVVKNDGNA